MLSGLGKVPALRVARVIASPGERFAAQPPFCCERCLILNETCAKLALQVKRNPLVGMGKVRVGE